MSEFIFKEQIFEEIRLLGRGKSGYSRLVRDAEGRQYVIKQIHHEPCEYYQFGDKLAAEIHAYEVLGDVGIPIPELYDVDGARELLLKEYIEGPTIEELVRAQRITENHLEQMRKMASLLYEHGLNIDYYPTNFIVNGRGELYYIDYEYNRYDEQWSFEKWGLQYWQS